MNILEASSRRLLSLRFLLIAHRTNTETKEFIPLRIAKADSLQLGFLCLELLRVQNEITTFNSMYSYEYATANLLYCITA